MNPTISAVSEEGDVYKFTLANINVSLANSLRRTILSDIPTLAFFTDSYESNQCTIHVNTSRLHNEILKHRLSCIPIYMEDMSQLPGNYVLVVDVQNDTDAMMIVTTEHFRIQNKTNGNFLTESEQRRIFPPSTISNMYIDFARLRPRIGDTIPGEHIKLTAEFSVHTAKENGMFNVVSKCSYGNTIDATKVREIWDDQEAKLQGDGETKEDIEFQKRNFYILDAQRHYVEDSFDFVIQTLGVFPNKTIVKKACVVLINKMAKLNQELGSDSVPILHSETNMDNCFDVFLEAEDYTIGKVLEYILYEKFYVEDKILTFCGFKKFHPHNTESTVRLAYKQGTDKRMVANHVKDACMMAIEVFQKIYKMF